jgi:hypothetical protein
MNAVPLLLNSYYTIWDNFMQLDSKISTTAFISMSKVHVLLNDINVGTVHNCYQKQTSTTECMRLNRCRYVQMS